MSYASVVAGLAELGVEFPPVALAFVAGPSAGVAVEARPAVSACAFWRRAEREVFFVAADAHRGCAVGAYVMGFPLSEATRTALAEAVGLMGEVGYLDGDEVAHIPRVGKAAAGTLYGPLALFTIVPDAVLVWVTPAQAMVLCEALKTTAWTGQPGPGLMGRPACGAVAAAINRGHEALSLGCAGMRTFTEVAPSLALLVIPGAAVEQLAESLERTTASNAAMLTHYRARQHDFT